MMDNDLVFDWNRSPREGSGEPDLAPFSVELDDETMRDGLQSPSVTAPSLEKRIRFLHMLSDIGVQGVNVGMPAAGPRHAEAVLSLVKEIDRANLPLMPNCAARTLVNDVRKIVDLSQAAGVPIEVATFIGSSPIRQLVEKWDVDFLRRAAKRAVLEASKASLPVMFVTEDTSRTHPDVLRTLYMTAIEAGARRICIADTVGCATPHGARRLVRFMRNLESDAGVSLKVDWHGHMDRGLGIWVALAAHEAGADRLHGSFLGLGERVGNTPLDLLLVNLKLMGIVKRDLTRLGSYVSEVADWMGVPVPFNYPVFGRDAYRTGTGVHAAAMIKALKIGDEELSERVYSAASPSWFGLRQSIGIGPNSGESNILYWLESNEIEGDPLLVKAIKKRAKDSDRVLDDEELWEEVRRWEKR
ncbi:MAG: LeuA family protein [Acidobacteriota bacterium]|jgi:2-isopropylmalate synthase